MNIRLMSPRSLAEIPPTSSVTSKIEEEIEDFLSSLYYFSNALKP